MKKQLDLRNTHFKKIKNIVMLMLFALMITGCSGEPTMDASTEENIKASIKEMGSSLTEAEKDKFANSVTSLAMKIGMKGIFAKKSKNEIGDEFAELIDGKTVGEIIKLEASIKEPSYASD